MRTAGGWLALGVVVLVPVVSRAYFLDKDRNFDVRLRAYTQVAILTEKAREADGLWPKGCDVPDPNNPGHTMRLANCLDFSPGDIASHRTFWNPEFDAKLTNYVRWSREVRGLSLFAPDEFKFRFAWWGFYDGIFDYLDPQWNDARRASPAARQSLSDDPRKESFNFNDENKNPRHLLAQRNRINELYLDYAKGRVFFRVGRQSISWGESDTIALLDIQNPFDLTLGAPGFFMDIDEARIPLWTIRNTLRLVDSWGPISGLFSDVYLVPGPIDTTIPITTPALFGYPYSSPGADPQPTQVPAVVRNLEHISIVERLPENTWGNSRWGARLEGVVNGSYTVSGWFFRTFPENPTPLLVGPNLLFDPKSKPTLIDDRGFRTPVCLGPDGRQIKSGTGVTPAGRTCSFAKPIINLLIRRLVSVAGVGATWYSTPLNGVIRTEAEFFINQDAFIPHENLNPRVLREGPSKTFRPNHIPQANYLRWTVGYDKFFFIRALNPSNSFTLVATHNGSWNVSSSKSRDFRSVATKPGKTQSGPLGQTEPDTNWEDEKEFEHFFQFALQTDYLHGKLSPRIVTILDPSGIFAFAVGATYRITDYLLLTPTFFAVEASRRPAGIATFRDRDQFQLRLTYQLN
jgi:hypothetical protein